jgi:hypothetical protein
MVSNNIQYFKVEGRRTPLQLKRYVGKNASRMGFIGLRSNPFALDRRNVDTYIQKGPVSATVDIDIGGEDSRVEVWHPSPDVRQSAIDKLRSSGLKLKEVTE